MTISTLGKAAALAMLAAAVIAQPRESAAGTAEPERAKLVVAWSRAYGGDEEWQEYKAAALSSQNDLWVGVGVRDLSSGSVSSWIWRVGPDGKKLGAYRIAEPPEQQTQRSPSYSDIKALVPLANGDILAVVGFAGDRPWLVRLDRNGKLVMAREILGRGREVWISRMVATADGHYLLLGHEGLDALAVKIDATGKILWEKKEDRGRMELFVDGLASPDGGLAVVGNSGTYDFGFRGESIVWVGVWDRDGKKLGEKMLPGRDGSLTRAAGGGYGLVYDQSGSEERKIRFQLLGPGLEELRSSAVADLKEGRVRFRVFPAASGDAFIVGGAKDWKPYLVRISGKGEPAAAFFDDAMEAGLNYDAIPAPDGLFVASSIVQKLTGKPAQQAVRLVRLVYR